MHVANELLRRNELESVDGLSYLVSLDARKQTAIRESMRERVPTNPDGSISLMARAWAIRASV